MGTELRQGLAGRREGDPGTQASCCLLFAFFLLPPLLPHPFVSSSPFSSAVPTTFTSALFVNLFGFCLYSFFSPFILVRVYPTLYFLNFSFSIFLLSTRFLAILSFTSFSCPFSPPLFPCHFAPPSCLLILFGFLFIPVPTVIFFAAAPPSPRSLFPFFLPRFQRFRAGFREPSAPRSSRRCARAQGALATTTFRRLALHCCTWQESQGETPEQGEGRSLGFSLEPWASRARGAAPGGEGPSPRARPLCPARCRQPV